MTAPDTGRVLCRLLGAWVNGTALTAAELPDFEALFQTAGRQLLAAAACTALESTGLLAACPPRTAKKLQDAKAKSIRKTLLMDAERRRLLALFDQRGIWYAPLKGPVINALYPQYGTRRFADNDILFDAARRSEVRRLMRRQGYTVRGERHECHDACRKPPVYNFEMHHKLFAENGRSKFLAACTAYYRDVRQRLVKDEGSGFGYHFRDEDLYVYLLAHAFKHYDGAGTGLRTLFDLWLYRQKKPALDGGYIAAELEKLGLTDFECCCRSLAGKLFAAAAAELAPDEATMLGVMEGAGAYGTEAHRLQGDLQRLSPGAAVTGRTRAKYLWRLVFPDLAWYRAYAPFAYRHRWAIPFFWVRRMFGAVFARRERNLRRLRALFAPPGAQRGE